MQFSIRHKMFLSLMAVIITFVAIISFILHYLLADIIRKEIIQTMENSVLVYHRFDDQRRELMLTQANSMAQTAHLKATLTIPDVDTETIYYAGIGLKDIANTELMLIVAESGELLSDINDVNLSRISLTALPGIDAALKGENYCGIWDYNQHFFRVAISPIVVGEQLVGLIVIGQRIDSSEAIQLAKDVAGTQVVLSANDQVLTAEPETIQDGKRVTDLRALLSAVHTGKIIGYIGGVALAEATIAGDSYITATIGQPVWLSH